MSELPDIEQFREYIAAALVYAGGSHTVDDIREAVEAGQMQFWPGIASCFVTEIVEYPRHRALNIVIAAGNLAELKAMTPGVLAWGKERGCVRASFAGRKGWERTFLRDDGWQSTLVVMERAL